MRVCTCVRVHACVWVRVLTRMPLLWVYCRCGTGGSYCGIGCCCWHAADKDDVSGHALLLQNVVILITTTIDVILKKKLPNPDPEPKASARWRYSVDCSAWIRKHQRVGVLVLVPSRRLCADADRAGRDRQQHSSSKKARTEGGKVVVTSYGGITKVALPMAY